MTWKFSDELRRSNSSRARLAAIAGGALILFSAGRAGAASSQVETIVVTAEKRAENPQDVPVSLQVIAGQTMAQQNLNSLEDVAQTVPSVHINGTGSGGQIFVRGIGSGTSLQFDQSVGMFVDDVYHGRAHVTVATFLDLDRVEILKGPQSTFFGNNAIAGALNIVSAKPSDTFGGWARGLYGEHDQYAAESAINIPIDDTLAVRVAGAFDGMAGWQKNVSGIGQGQTNQAGRITLLFKPMDDLDATLKIEGSKSKDHAGSQIGDCPPPAPFVSAGFCNTAIGLGIPTGIGSRLNTTSAGQEVDLSTFENVLTINYRQWDHTFTSVTGFYNYHSQQSIDADGTPSTLLNLQIADRYHQFSQEFRVASATDQTIEYLAGVYFQADQLKGRPTDLSYFFLSPTILAKPAFAPLIPYLPLGASGTYAQNEHSYAVFGSLGWNLTDRLKISGGLRGSWVQKSETTTSFDGTATQPYGGIVELPDALQPLATKLVGGFSTSSAMRSDNAWIPSARIQYKFDPAAMIYFTYANGFKAGIPFGGLVNGVPAPSVLPENVDSYEAGLKSEWFDQSVLLNLDVFRSDYSNLQVTSAIFTPLGVPVIFTTNAASSVSQGVEFEGQWAIDDHLHVGSAITYLDAHYVSYPNVTLTGLQTYCRAHAALPACVAQFPAGVPILQDLSGQPTGFSPKWSGGINGTFTTAVVDDFHLTGEANAYFSSSYNYANNGTDDPLLQQPGYVRLDLRLTLKSPDRQWALDLLGKNLTNRTIIAGGTGGTSLPTSLGSILIRKEQPRNFAAQLRYQW